MATETDVRPMDDKHRNILKRCKGTLVKDMDPCELLLQMADSLLFTTEDENTIKSKVTRRQQCEALLEMLPRKSAKAYEIFKKTLENVHPHLAGTIVEAELQFFEANCKDVENRLKKKQEELQFFEANCKDVENRLKKKQEELKDVEGKCKDVESRLNEKHEELKTVEAKGKETENRLERKQEELKDAERKCKDEENRLEKKQEAFNKSRQKCNCGKKSKYTKKAKRKTRALTTLTLKVGPAGVTTKLNEQEKNSLLERITSFAKAGLEYFPLTDDESLKTFCNYLTNSIHIHLTGKEAGSLILSVHCRTLEILEKLWQDYSSGHLDSVVKECFLTDETTIDLEATIAEEEYLRCRKFLTEISGVESLTDDESVAMENIKYKNILLKFYVLLLEKLDPNEVSVQLLTAGVLTSDDKEKVEEKPSQREKSEELLMILATKGPRAYEEFVKALEKNHCFLACQLLKEEKENLLYEVREREWLLNETMSDLLLEEERAITAASENEKLKAQLEKGSEEIADEEVEVKRLLKKTKDEISVKSRKKEASRESSAEAVLKELDIQLPEEEGEVEQKEVAKLLKEVNDEISVENRKKEGRKDSGLEAASVKELNIQPQEGETSQQPSEQEGTLDQSIERETSEDMLCLVAEVEDLKTILSERERQQKESEKLQKQMIDELEEMKLQLQHVLNKKDTSFFSLKKPEETRKRETSVQQKEKEELKAMIKQCEQMNKQVEQLQLVYC